MKRRNTATGILAGCVAAMLGLTLFGANTNSAEQATPTNKVIVSKNHDKAKWTLVEDLRFTNGLDRTLWTQFAYHPWQMKRPPSIITNDNLAYAAGGLLHLQAELNPKIDETYSYMGRGGRLWTRGKLNLHYGKVEIKARIDDQKGGAVAFWMMPEACDVKWPLCGEIDIVERLNLDRKVYQTVHSSRVDKEGKLWSPKWHNAPPVEPRDWNVYGFEWYPDELVWTVNGRVTHRYPKLSDRKEDWPWTVPYYLRLEVAAEDVKKSWVGPLDPSTLPFEARIESVKLYTGELDGKPFGKVIWLDGRDGGGFTNPVLTQDWPDPALWQVDDRFYSVATGLKTICRSSNAIDWLDMGIDPLTPNARQKLFSISKNLWAPCVVKFGDEWLLYISLFISDLDCRIEVLSSKSPTGPFEYVGEVVDSRAIGILNTIDPYVLEADGKVWMFFGSCQDGVHRVELAADGRAIRAGAKPVHVAGVRNPGPSGKEPYTNIWCKPGTWEGSFLLKRHGWWYLFVSGGKYTDHTYYLTVGRSRTIDGEFLDRDGHPLTAGIARPILASDKGDEMYGPGHNGEVAVSDDGRDFMFFHCHDAGRPANERPTFLQEMKWTTDAWPTFEGGRPKRTGKRFQAVRLSRGDR